MSNEETKDCARLPVVAVIDSDDETATGYAILKPDCDLRDGTELCRLTDAQSLATDLRLELNAKRLKLCAALKERNDAQARLAEKDARIAQLAAHARGKNKALANALKEIEILREANLRLDEEWQAMRHDLSVAQEQLEQLQAAPAERGVDSMLRKKAPQPPTLARCGTGALYGEQTYCFEKGWRQGIAAYRKMLRRLNPAPTTADSDVREVKP